MTADRVALIDWDESHVDVPDLDLVLPHNAAGLDDDAHDIARASVGRMGSRRLLGRRVRGQAARRSSSGLSRRRAAHRLWDYQDGLPGRGDAKIIPSTWFSLELQATSPVPEWNGQRVRMALEEDMMMIDAAGVKTWALRRQTEFHLMR